MKLIRKAGKTSQTLYVFIQDSSSTTGAGLTGLVYNTSSLVAYYVRGLGNATAITLATQTVTGAFSSGGFVEVSSSNMPGLYRLDVPDAALAASADSVVLMLKGATNMAPLLLEIDLVAYDPADAVRLGLTALPNAAAEASGGLITRGTSTGQLSVSGGVAQADAAKINGVATTSVTTINANIGSTQPVNFTGTGGSALVKSDAVDIGGTAAPTFPTNFASLAITAAGGVTLADGVAHGGTPGSSTATLALASLNTTNPNGDAWTVVSTGNGGNACTFYGDAANGGMGFVALGAVAAFLRSLAPSNPVLWLTGADGAATVLLDAGNGPGIQIQGGSTDSMTPCYGIQIVLNGTAGTENHAVSLVTDGGSGLVIQSAGSGTHDIALAGDGKLWDSVLGKPVSMRLADATDHGGTLGSSTATLALQTFRVSNSAGSSGLNQGRGGIIEATGANSKGLCLYGTGSGYGLDVEGGQFGIYAYGDYVGFRMDGDQGLQVNGGAGSLTHSPQTAMIVSGPAGLFIEGYDSSHGAEIKGNGAGKHDIALTGDGILQGDLGGRILGNTSTAFSGVGAQVDVEQWRSGTPNVLISGRVDANAQVVGDKTGYSLTQTFPTNFADLAITASTGRVTVGTNADKTGYSLTVTPPTAAQVTTAVWTDLLASSDFSTANSIGKLLKDDIDAAISSAGGGSLTAAGVWAYATRTLSGTTDANLVTWKGSVPNNLITGRVDANAQVVGGTVVVSGYTSGEDPASLVLGAAASSWNTTGTIGAELNAIGAGLTAADVWAYGTRTLTGIVTANVTQWKGSTVPTPTVSGVPIVDIGYVGGTAATTSATVAANVTQWQGVSPNALISGRVDAVASVVNDKSGYSLTVPPPTAAQVATAVWQDVTSGADFTIAGSVGKLLKDDVDTPISSRSTYAGTDTPGTTTLLTRLPQALLFDGSGYVKSDPQTSVTVGAYASGLDPATMVLGATAASWNTTGTIGSKINTSASVSGLSAADVWAYSSRTLTSGAAPSASAVATAVWQDLTTGSDFTTVDSIGKRLADNLDVAVSTRMATFSLPTNFSALAITSGGAVTVGTNNDKTGYSLTQAFPANFSSLAITASTGRVTVGGYASGQDPATLVLDATASGHNTAGTIGAAIGAAGSAGDPWATTVPGSYGAGTAGYILGTNLNAAVTSRAASFTLPTNFSSLAIDTNGRVKVQAGIIKNSAVANFTFLMVDATTREPLTGLTVTATRRLDGGAYAACANAVTEIANGMYTINLAASDTNGDKVDLRFAAATAEDLDICIFTTP